MTDVSEVIRKRNGKWYLYTADGSKKLGGPYTSRAQAVKREKQVQYFKHKGESAMAKKDDEKIKLTLPKGYKPINKVIKAAVEKIGLTIGEKGDVSALIDSFGDWADGSHATCVKKLSGVEGIDDPEKLCAWMKDQYTLARKAANEAARAMASNTRLARPRCDLGKTA